MADRQDQSGLQPGSLDDEHPDCPSPHSGKRIYEIHVHGHLRSDWAEWLEGFEMLLLENGEMILSGLVVDQSALMGVLNKLSHLNLTLLSVNQVNQKGSITK